jgi:hypothetical protein
VDLSSAVGIPAEALSHHIIYPGHHQLISSDLPFWHARARISLWHEIIMVSTLVTYIVCVTFVAKVQTSHDLIQRNYDAPGKPNFSQ